MGCSDLKSQEAGRKQGQPMRGALPWLEGKRGRGGGGQTTFLEFSLQLGKS